MIDYYTNCKTLSKIDLHVHLNALFNTELIQEILLNEEVILPKDFQIEKDLNVLSPKHSLARYFKPWEVLRLV